MIFLGRKLNICFFILVILSLPGWLLVSHMDSRSIVLGNLLEAERKHQLVETRAWNYWRDIYPNGSPLGSHMARDSRAFGLWARDMSNCHFPTKSTWSWEHCFPAISVPTLDIISILSTQDGCQSATRIYVASMPFQLDGHLAFKPDYRNTILLNWNLF